MVSADTLQQYIESKKGVFPEKTIADYVLDGTVITANDLKFMDNIYQTYKNQPPFGKDSKTTLFNMHQDRATWLLMLLYQALGAKIEAAYVGLSKLDFAHTALQASNILLHDKIPSKPFQRIVDCGGACVKAKASHGMVELTQTYPDIYEGITTPVISINYASITGLASDELKDSLVKSIEAFNGTGQSCFDALPLAFKEQFKRDNGRTNTAVFDGEIQLIYQHRLKNNFYLLIGGAGKVAAGFAHALIKAGIDSRHIILQDIQDRDVFAYKMDDTSTLTMLRDEHGALVTLDDKIKFKQSILKHMQTVHPDLNYNESNFMNQIAIVTATGVENLLSSKGYSPKDFSQYAWYINMGQPNEFGANFETDEKFGNTDSAVNFNSKWLKLKGFATETRYLMPCFAALAECSIYAVNHKSLNKGLNGVPAQVDIKLLNMAIDIYGEEFLPMQKLQHMLYPNYSSPTSSQLTLPMLNSGSDSRTTSPTRSSDRRLTEDMKRKTEENESTMVRKRVMFTEEAQAFSHGSQGVLTRSHTKTALPLTK